MFQFLSSQDKKNIRRVCKRLKILVDQEENSGYRYWNIRNKLFDRDTANEWFSLFRKVEIIKGKQM